MKTPSTSELQERLDAWRERFSVAGCSVGWMLGDEHGEAASGVTNVNTGVEVTPDTLFQIGSITKVYTTTLIMQLVDEGRIVLDAPAVAYLPDLRFADADATARVTVRHLLTHTSGVDGDFFDEHGRNEDAVERYVAACAKLPFVFESGKMWSYCNAGFVVLGRIVEIMTGMPWHVALRERLLEPLGVTHTLTRPEDALLYRAAAGHTVGFDRTISLTQRWSIGWSSGPAGATPNSTVADLLTFARMHLDGGVARDGTRLLSEASVRAMQEPQVTLPEHPGGTFADQWGLGWMLFDWGRRVIGHDGGTLGQNSSLRILPEERFAVSVLTNTTPSGGILCTRIMRWMFEEYAGIEMAPYPKPPEEAPDIDLSPYVGTYERNEQRIEISERDGQLVAAVIMTGPLATADQQMPPTELYAVNERVFLQRTPGTGVYTPVSFLEFDHGRPQYFFSSRLARRTS
ncbi:MAG TPA: serine hydrolase domain-containing protein [Dehalococcoidia bacterium]|nr:serine hydrolase domain-containing protein [Dehalococcoidia bacterium]